MKPILMTPKDHERLSRLAAHWSDTADRFCVDALEDELANAQVVGDEILPADVVTMNSEVTVVDLDTAQELRLRVVFPGAADIDRGFVSVLAPIGVAILGSREKDVLTWKTPNRVRRVRIARVTYQPEANGDPG
jgi:regulator of nucleoside diphosphate kinase